ncbi:class II fructose-bisphosphate aldolase [Escherichia coli]|nr:class II fructose-bisphosphate aldolase [Escherichia coli]
MSTTGGLNKAQQKGHATLTFKIHNFEMSQVVVDTAAESRSPLIVADTPGSICSCRASVPI